MTADTVNIPGYRVIRPLGVGGMASVYLAVQESLDREVALKVMAPALAANQEFTDRFLKEGRITAKLNHPNLVTIFDIGQHGTLYYLAAEYVPGGTLREKLTAGISVAESLNVVRDVAHGLHFAHENGFVHRDVKPGNVLFRANGSAVLADFGIAKAIDQTSMATQVGNSIGTPHYMSPEQARAEKVDGRSDLYGLGAMLFELLTGHPPYEADDPFSIALMHVTKPVPQLPVEHAWLQSIINRMMAKDPLDRFSSGADFVAALENLMASGAEHKKAGARKGHETNMRSAARFRDSEMTAFSKQSSVQKAISKKSAWYWGIAGLLAATVTVVAAVFWTQPKLNTAGTVIGSASDEKLESTADSIEIPVTDLTLVGNGELAEFLTKAKGYLKLGLVENGRRLSSPSGDCAVDLYWQVLRQDQGNVEAKTGLRQIADFYESKAKAAFDRGYYSGSMVLAEEGLKAMPDSASLKKIVEESGRASGL